jgi:hypothetical protein
MHLKYTILLQWWFDRHIWWRESRITKLVKQWAYIRVWIPLQCFRAHEFTGFEATLVVQFGARWSIPAQEVMLQSVLKLTYALCCASFVPSISDTLSSIQSRALHCMSQEDNRDESQSRRKSTQTLTLWGECQEQPTPPVDQTHCDTPCAQFLMM